MVPEFKDRQPLTPLSTPSILALAKILSPQFHFRSLFFSEIQLGTRLHCSRSRLRYRLNGANRWLSGLRPLREGDSRYSS
jgi:hypothetical protein